jgi:hypothetical protein
MKFPAAVFALLLTFSASAQQETPEGYFTAPTFSITGDFDGDGKQDTLNQFITDSLGNTVQYMKEIDTETWDEYVYTFATYGYMTGIALAGKEDNLLSFNRAQGVYCLANVGNINHTKGDEIAIIPDFVDQSRHSYCYIYALCNGTWQQVFHFSVHEDAFDDFNGSPYTTIPGILERQNGVWMYYDYLDMDYQSPEDVGHMLPLKGGDCE